MRGMCHDRNRFVLVSGGTPQIIGLAAVAVVVGAVGGGGGGGGGGVTLTLILLFKTKLQKDILFQTGRRKTYSVWFLIKWSPSPPSDKGLVVGGFGKQHLKILFLLLSLICSVFSLFSSLSPVECYKTREEIFVPYFDFLIIFKFNIFSTSCIFQDNNVDIMLQAAYSCLLLF